jgi:hypothetical protein
MSLHFPLKISQPYLFLLHPARLWKGCNWLVLTEHTTIKVPGVSYTEPASSAFNGVSTFQETFCINNCLIYFWTI